MLAAHFLKEFCEAYGKKPRDFTPAAMDVLLAYTWPGNVRELKNLVERLVIMCPSPRIEPHHLPPEIFRGARQRARKNPMRVFRKPARLTNASLSFASWKRIAGI